ncbi:MAG: hypothetical protein ACRET5_17380 [Steroidobacteraceae bacterium]
MGQLFNPFSLHRSLEIMIMTTSTNERNFVPDTGDRLPVGPSTHSRGGYIRFGRYGSGEIALKVVDEEGDTQYVATASLVPQGGPYPGEYAVWLKGWSENEGVPKALADAGIVTLTGRRNLAGFAEAEHAELTERARTALDAKREGLTAAAHREVDELLKLGMIPEHRAEQLKRLLITEAIEDHDQDGMSIREIVDMYRDVIEPT